MTGLPAESRPIATSSGPPAALHLAVRDLDAHVGGAGYRREDADLLGGQRERDVVLEVADLVDPLALAHLDPERRDERARHVVDDLALQAELLERALQAALGLLQLLARAGGRGAVGVRAQHREGRQLVALGVVARARRRGRGRATPLAARLALGSALGLALLLAALRARGVAVRALGRGGRGGGVLDEVGHGERSLGLALVVIQGKRGLVGLDDARRGTRALDVDVGVALPLEDAGLRLGGRLLLRDLRVAPAAPTGEHSGLPLADEGGGGLAGPLHGHVAIGGRRQLALLEGAQVRLAAALGGRVQGLARLLGALADLLDGTRDREAADDDAGDDDAREDDVADGATHALEQAPGDRAAHVAAERAHVLRRDHEVGVDLGLAEVERDDGQDRHDHEGEAERDARAQALPLGDEEGRRERPHAEARHERVAGGSRHGRARRHDERDDHGDGEDDQQDREDVPGGTAAPDGRGLCLGLAATLGRLVGAPLLLCV